MEDTKVTIWIGRGSGDMLHSHQMLSADTLARKQTSNQP